MSNSLAVSFRKRSIAMRASLALAIAASLSMAAMAPQQAQARVDLGISVNLAPPPLPVYEQPYMPGPGYIWTPGYWSYDPSYGYYWVPGTWIRPPYYGALWTPGYWGWNGGVYVFNRGYWGRHVGYYGGINYGYGYGGRGYEGGYWRGTRFYYNRAANRVNVNIHINVYDRPVHNVTTARVSFNGPGGVNVRATSIELTYAKERHTAPVPDQVRQHDAARNDKTLRVSENKGNPPVAATERPGVIAKPQGGQADNGKGGNDNKAGNGNASNGNDNKAGNDRLVSGRIDAGAASGKGDAGKGSPASSAASDRQDKAAKLREQANVGAKVSAARDANASASSDNDANAKVNRSKRNPRAASGSTAQDNGNAMSSPANASPMGNGNGEQPPVRQHKQRGNAHPPMTDSQPQQQEQPMPMRSPRTDRGQNNNGMQQPRGQVQNQGQPRTNDHQGQPRQDKGQKQDRKHDKDQNQDSSGR